MSTKRQHVSFLPSVVQTDTLKKFFSSTVDQFFQPGQLEQISGFIGGKPSYTNLDQDFYISEINAERQAHQLEPMMVVRNSDGSVQELLCYDDLINYIERNGGNTTNHNRLFSDSYYSWSPPIDLDKITNFGSYYWFGDDPNSIPTIILQAESRNYIADGYLNTYELPAFSATIDASLETPVAFVDGVSVSFTRSGDHNIILNDIPNEGSEIVVYRYGDLRPILIGKSNPDVTYFTGEPITLTSNMRVRLIDARLFGSFDTYPMEFINNHDSIHSFDDYSYDTAGYDLSINSMSWDKNEVPDSYWLEGVGTSISLIPFNYVAEYVSVFYVTMDRRCGDRNPWSRNNYWVHSSSLDWTGLDFTSRKATRPIIEFISDIQLYDYGWTRKEDVTALLTGNPMYCPVPIKRIHNVIPSDFDIVAFDTTPWDSDGLFEIPLSEINGKPMNTVFVDGEQPLLYGDKLLVLANDDVTLVNRVLDIYPTSIGNVSQDPNSVYKTPKNTTVMAVEASDEPNIGDIRRIPLRGFVPYDGEVDGYSSEEMDYSDHELEFWFDGKKWNPAQKFNNGADPLFELFDEYGNSFDNNNSISYNGNRLFGYTIGSGTTDSVLNRQLSYDSNGQIQFTQDLVTNKALISGSSWVGYQWYRINASDITKSNFGNSWYQYPNKSQQTETNGVWSLPLNLIANPNNLEVSTIAKGQFFDQFTTDISAQENISGSAYSINSWRDTKRVLGLGNNILQHRSTLLKTMLMASNSDYDYFDSLRYVEREYTRFKTRFTQNVLVVLKNGQRLESDDPSLWVSTVLNNLKANKTKQFPFAYSDMAGGQYYIPPTPAFLGVLPCSVPRLEIDDTYSSPVTFICGHDGSRQPAFGDIRDTILLALETQIYNNIIASFKTQDNKAFDFYNYDDALSRQVSYSSLRYSIDEINTLLEPYFVAWATTNKLDFRTNTSFVEGSSFTWNYNGVKDIKGNVMNGSWRSIYRFWYDTDRPHLAPWEMLGFLGKPYWWDQEYGPAPYTNGNKILWDDIRDGRIAQGIRIGIDARFARPDIYNFMPVDEGGNLRDPITIGIIPNAPLYPQSASNWKFGDQGPVENLWMCSSAYRFALAAISCLMRPAEWFDTTWDAENFVEINSQWMDQNLECRPQASQLQVHGETDASGNIIKRLGIQQWIVDYMTSLGRSPTTLGTSLRGMDIILGYRMGGFAKASDMRVYADNFGIVPDQDISIVYHQPPALRETFYSGIIIEKVIGGWRVIGYNPLDSNFPVIMHDPAGPQTKISLGTNPIIYDWKPNVYYKIGQLVNYSNAIYICIASHTSGKTFEKTFWQNDPSATIIYPEVSVYTRSNGITATVAYGTIFPTQQDLAQFICNYFRWLDNEGFIFDEINVKSGEIQDWVFSVKEYLNWTQMNWAVGNFIALSPASSTLKFKTSFGTVYSLENTTNGVYGLIDRTGRPIDRLNTFVGRNDDTTIITTSTNDLYGARILIGAIEHVMLFSNTTIFNDIIYSPLYNLVQPRLHLIGMRSSNWTGRMDAEGYVIYNNDLLANATRAEEDVRTMFDIETSADVNLRDHARHLIGYQKQSFLDSLLISETQQFEYYQGMITEQGTPNVFSRLNRSRLIDANRNLSFLEEWAFKLGSFGSTKKKNYVSFSFLKSDMHSDPQLIVLGSPVSNDSIDRIPLNDSRFIDRPASASIIPYVNYFDLDKIDWLPSAGYVRMGETDLVLFDMTQLNDLYTATQTTSKYITFGTTIWVYDRGDLTFTVLSAFGLGNLNYLSFIQTNVDDQTLQASQLRLVFNLPHNLTADDVGLKIIVSGTSSTNPDFEGVQTITAIDSPNSFIIDFILPVQGISYSNTNPAPTIILLRPMRFDTRIAAQNFFSRIAPTEGQMIYVDQTEVDPRWTVYTYTNGDWVISRQQPDRINPQWIADTIIYGNETYIDNSGQQITVNPVYKRGLTVLHPLMGLVPGEAKKELSYILDYDPANYLPDANQWTKAQVGKLWWNINTMRILDAETDYYDSAFPTRNQAELSYRQAYWGKFAPGSSIEIYEWTRSYLSPFVYNGNFGYVLNSSNPNYVYRSEYDPTSRSMIDVYYFWSLNPTSVPLIDGRNISAMDVANYIGNPNNSGLATMMPITRESFYVNNIAQFLNDASSVFEICLSDPTDNGIAHQEWTLVQPNGPTDQIPSFIEQKLIDSLVGFDRIGQTVPNSSVNSRWSIGFEPRQSVFVKDTILSARQSFVQNINNILAKRDLSELSSPPIETILTAETPSFSNLIWSQPAESRAIAFPPENSWDYVVDDINSRNLLLKQLAAPHGLDAFNLLGKARNPRILIRRLEQSIPSFSIWEIDVTKFTATASPDDYLNLATNYTVVENTHVLMVLHKNNYVIGQRILVQNDENYSGFWTVFSYNPSNSNADANGFVLENVQTYRVKDFWSLVDWYDTGYSSSDIPTNIYATIHDRDNNQPITSQLVEVTNDGSGNWIWCVYDGTVWSVVARQNGTIQLSNSFYDSSKSVFGLTAPNTATLSNDIINRDGSLELQYILNVLFDTILLVSEKNELFFGLLHFIHTQQEEIKWCFKTSFISLYGFNEILQQSAIQTNDNIDNLITYVEEVKPYRVKTRDFTRTLSPNVDSSNVHSTDFDKPIYYDASLSSYRRLDETNSNDIKIMEVDKNYIDYIGIYDNLPNPVRKLEISIYFDRISSEIPSTDLEQSAINRIEEYYTPVDGMIEKNADTLMKIGFNGVVYDGASLVSVPTLDTILDGQTSGELALNPIGYANLLIDPNHYGNPEELVQIETNDAVSIIVDQVWAIGAPIHDSEFITSQNISGNEIVLSTHIIPNDNQSVMVYKDGIRQYDQYNVLPFDRKVIIDNDSTIMHSVMVHTIDTSFLDNVTEYRLFGGDGVTTDFQLLASHAYADAIVDGVPLIYGVDYSLNGDILHFNIAPKNNSDILVHCREEDTNELLNNYSSLNIIPNTDLYQTRTTMHVESFDFADTTQTWNLTHRSTSVPEFVGTIVEVDGLRLTPPFTRYGFADGTRRSIPFKKMLSTNDIKLWIDGVLYTGHIAHLKFDHPFCDRLQHYYDDYYRINDFDSDYFDSDIPYDFILLGDQIVINNKNMNADKIIISAFDEYDYTVNNGVLIITKPLYKSSFDYGMLDVYSWDENILPPDSLPNIKVTTFENDQLMDIQTIVYHGLNSNTYRLTGHVLKSLTTNDILVSVNGYMLTPTLDYTIKWPFMGYDSYLFDFDAYDEMAQAFDIVLRQSLTEHDRVVITIFNGHKHSPFDTWAGISKQPSLSMMGNKVNTNGMITYDLHNSYAIVDWLRSEEGILISDIDINSTEISVSLNPYNVAKKLIPENPFDVPSVTHSHPGAIMIDGERIEYFSMVEGNNIVTFSGLRRATNGTSLVNHTNGVRVHRAEPIVSFDPCPFMGAELP